MFGLNWLKYTFMLHTFDQPVAVCCNMLDDVGSNLKRSNFSCNTLDVVWCCIRLATFKHISIHMLSWKCCMRLATSFNTCRNIMQQCCKMLRWNVASLWPDLYTETRSRNQCHVIVPHENINHPCSENHVLLVFHCLNSRIENDLTLTKS